MSGLPEVPLRGILEAYQAMHPSIKGRAYWRIGLDYWKAILLDRRCLNMVIDPVGLGGDPSFLHLPVEFVPSVVPEDGVVLCIRADGRWP